MSAMKARFRMNPPNLRSLHAADWWTALRLAVCLVCLASVLVFFWESRHWAVVNDAAQINYVCFLMDHGRAPYRDIIEMNMPGIYLTNGAVLHLFGSSATAWRYFDLSLLVIAGCAMFSIARPYDWFAGIYAGALLALFHGKDGPAQAGQRDLIIAVLLLCACSLMFSAVRRQRPFLLGLTGLCLSAATMIKPITAVVLVFLLPALWMRIHTQKRRASLWMLGGLAVPALIVLIFLADRGAVSSYVYVLHDMLPFYARLGRTNTRYLVTHCLTPPIAIITLIGFGIAFLKRTPWQWEERVLMCGMAFGAFSYVLQGKGFPYHRYPLMAFLLLWSGIQMAHQLREKSYVRLVAAVGLIFGACTAPLYARRAAHRYWDESYNVALAGDLKSLGGARLSGHVQCFTTAGDCDTTLYRLKLVQSSGLIYDYFVFGSQNEPVVLRSRQRVWRELQQTPPEVIVMGRGSFPDDFDGSYNKIAGWPSLAAFLADNYTVLVERAFSPAESGIRGYRLYVLKAHTPTPLQPVPARLPNGFRQATSFTAVGPHGPTPPVKDS